MVDPDIQLTQMQRTDLAMMYHSKGWDVFAKTILPSIVEQFRVDLDNTDPAKTADVIAKHSLSRSASVVTALILQRMLQEAMSYEEVKNRNVPVEGAPGLDLDDLAASVDHLPNLLGDVNFIAETDALEEEQQ